nr:polynucleotide adenylyltransferase PcnB [Candidatus Pandoraea novymonadis]
MIRKFIKKLLSKRDNAPNSIMPENAPIIIKKIVHNINPTLLSKNAIQVIDTLQQAGYKAFVVGGAVRDLLLGIQPKDFDVATNAHPEQVKRLFRRAHIIGRRFQIVHVRFGSEIIETSTFRAMINIENSKQIGTCRSKRSELDRKTHVTDESGRVLRDNVWGRQDEDAARRDFTVNAMYYDPSTQTVHDYHGGWQDIQSRVMRIIGDPATRFREDPVRMLRIVRFAAKLNFSIDETTQAPIRQLAPLIDNVPGARLFDEILKLLFSGHALNCVQKLRQQGLHHTILPLLDVVFEQPLGEKFVMLSLANTDQRIREGKSVSPSFLFAALLWHLVLEKWKIYQRTGQYPIPTLYLAMNDVLNSQTSQLAIQRRFISDMKEIWGLQARLDKRVGRRTPLRLLKHPRFRAGYDFLLLRCESGEIPADEGQWWTDFINGDPSTREKLLSQRKVPTANKRRRHSSRKSNGRSNETVTSENSGNRVL